MQKTCCCWTEERAKAKKMKRRKRQRPIANVSGSAMVERTMMRRRGGKDEMEEEMSGMIA